MASLEMNKIGAGVIGAGLTFMLLGFAAEFIYHPSTGDHGDEHAQGFVVELPEGDAGDAVVEAGPSIGELLLTASATDGEATFRACAACHKVEDGVNGVGPYLLNVMGRDIASAQGYEYDDALLSKADMTWTAENFSAFIENPRGWAPGTKMGYNGMRRDTDRADVIAYLVEASGQDINDFIVLPEADEAMDSEGVVEEITEAAADAGEAVVEVADNATDAVTETAQDAADVVENVATGAAAMVADAADAVTDAVETTGDAIADVAADATEEVVEAADAVADTATDVVADVTETQQETADAATTGVPAFMVNASAENGEGIFRRCAACHVLDAGVNRTGPSLHQIVGRDTGAVDGFRYSSAMAEMGGVWDYDSLNAFLESPRNYVPGTKMGFAGLRDQQDRADVIAYLEAAAQ